MNRAAHKLILFSLLLSLISACSAERPREVSVAEPDDDISMKLREARKVEVISSDIALKLADMVLRKSYGAATVDNQLPFTVLDQGDRWQINGTFRKPSSLDLKDPEGGYLTITIQKTNCRILDMARFLMLESPSPRPA